MVGPKVLIVFILFPSLVLVGSAYAQVYNQPSFDNGGYYKIPSWVKDNAKSWAGGSLGDGDFLKGINYLVNQTIIAPPSQTAASTPHGVPAWIKNVVKWWSENLIGDVDFLKGMQFLVSSNIIQLQTNAPTPPTPPHPQAQVSGKQLLIHIFSPNNPPDLLAVFARHLTPNDYTSNFQASNLDLYPNINHCLSGYSLDTVKAAITTSQTHSGIGCIAYDNEANNANLSSPPTELSDPAGSTNQAATLVKQAGLKFAAEPTFQLLMQEYQGVDWSKVDVLVMQTQKVTANDGTFVSDVTSVSNWVKSKNPDTLVFVQVNQAFDTTPHLISVVKAVSERINGVSVVLPDAATIEPLLVGIGR